MTLFVKDYWADMLKGLDPCDLKPLCSGEMFEVSRQATEESVSAAGGGRYLVSLRSPMLAAASVRACLFSERRRFHLLVKS